MQAVSLKTQDSSTVVILRSFVISTVGAGQASASCSVSRCLSFLLLLCLIVVWPNPPAITRNPLLLTVACC